MLVTGPPAGRVKLGASPADDRSMQRRVGPAPAPAGTSERRDDPDPHPWRAAFLITLMCVAVEMLLTLWIMPRVVGRPGWYIPGDAWPPIPAAHFIAYGAFPYLYERSPFFVAGPLLPVVLAPVAGIGSLLDLRESVPFPLRYPSIWLVYGPYAVGLSSFAVLAAVRRVAVQAGARTGLLRIQLAAVPLVLIPAAGIWAHFEEPLALACALLALGDSVRGRHTRAAILIGVAIGFKQWALLGVPLIVVAAPVGRRSRSLAWALAVPIAVYGIPLALDWSSAAPAILGARAFPQLGRAALWVPHTAHVLVGTPYRALAVACSIAVAWRIRGRATPSVLLAGLASVLLLRLLFEPVLFGYYLAPPLAVLLVYEVARTGRVARTVLFGSGALLLFAAHLPPVLWWAAEAAALAPIAGPALAEALALPSISRRTLVPAA